MLTSVIDTPLTLPTLLLLLLTAVVLGLLTALVFTFRCRHTASFALTLTLLPMAVSVIILLVNGNIGTGVAVAGAFALVRFRSVPGTAREIAAIFIEMALGLCLGLGYIGLAVIFFALTAIITLLLTAMRFGAPSATVKQMKITLPENVDYETLFDDVFEQYHVRADLQRIRTTNMGTLFELTYLLTFPTPQVPKAFMDELRIRNANLNIVIGAVTEHEAL
ncbi:MAG: DUF4956 domain-containing protein [Christensenellaceae bacterium]|nr:DUF4956 domain-containing protein [Christensenellaceae bacterium]